MTTPFSTRKTITSIVSQDIFDKIKEGTYKIGDKLPSENQLCSIYNVSRVTVRNALSELTDLKLVTKKNGVGTFVISDTSDIVSVNLSKEEFFDIIELRQAIEFRSVELFALRGDKSDLEILHNALIDMEKNIYNFNEYTKADIRFHEAIINGSGNKLFKRLFDSYRDDFANYLVALNETVGDENKPQAIINHRNVYEAILIRNSSEAKRIIQASMSNTYEKYRHIFDSKVDG